MNNGCRLRQSPSEPETGAVNEAPFWSFIEDVNLTYSVRLTLDGPEKLAARLAPLDEETRTLALLYVLWSNLGRDSPLKVWVGNSLQLRRLLLEERCLLAVSVPLAQHWRISSRQLLKIPQNGMFDIAVQGSFGSVPRSCRIRSNPSVFDVFTSPSRVRPRPDRWESPPFGIVWCRPRL